MKLTSLAFLLLLAVSTSVSATVTVLSSVPIVCEEGIKATNERRHKEAIASLDLCLSIRLTRNERSMALRARALSYSNMDMPEKALEDQRAAMSAAMSYDAWPLIMLSYYQKQLKQYDDALLTLKEAEGFDEDRDRPGPGMAISYHRGRIYYEMGRFADAVDALTKGMLKQPNYSPAYFYRGLAYQALGKSDEAKVDFLKVAELVPAEGYPANFVEKLEEFGIHVKLKNGAQKP